MEKNWLILRFRDCKPFPPLEELEIAHVILQHLILVIHFCIIPVLKLFLMQEYEIYKLFWKKLEWYANTACKYKQRK